MRRMGGLKKYMPSTRWTYLIACIAISGFPFFAGFASKDEILWKAFTSSATHGLLPYANIVIWAFGITAATLTAFYMGRSYFMTFTGEYRGNETPLVDPYPEDTARAKAMFVPPPVRGPTEEQLHHAHIHPHEHGDHGEHHDDHHHDHHGGTPHESPWTMTTPLWILAGASFLIWVVVGIPPVFASLWHGGPPALEHWLEPVLANGHEMMALYDTHVPAFSWLSDAGTKHLWEYGLAALSVGVASAGWFGAMWLYRDNANPLPERLLKDPASVLPKPLVVPVQQVHRLIYNKYFVDEGYYTVFVYGMAKVWNGLKNVDVYVVDGIVNAAAFVGKYFGFIQGAIDKYIVDGAVNLVADVVAKVGNQLRQLQTGQIRTYLLGAFGGAIACVAIIAAFS